ncbi:hypothetical protein [Pseudonocardia sp. GCM10023141]|uniref:hypothetical protein n=1 Tax=Pseudonocardia sp. GCM10023141 TaxID=3252653 RepID=UPI00360C3F78
MTDTRVPLQVTTPGLSPLMAVLARVGLLGSALVAGTFYAFSAFVMPALQRLPAAEGVAAMQSVNITAVQPAYLTVLLGTGGVCCGSAPAGDGQRSTSP